MPIKRLVLYLTIFSITMLVINGGIRYTLFLHDKSGAPNVLFIGNSLTFYSNMPRIFQKIARANGHSVNVRMQALPSYTLEQHLANTSTMEMIASKPWEYVVLQEGSGRASSDDYENDTIVPAVKLIDAIHVHSPKAQILIYETWPDKNEDPAIQTRFHENALKLALRTNAKVAPVGVVWQSYRREHPEVELYDFDQHHPSEQGSTVAAQVIYDTMIGRY